MKTIQELRALATFCREVGIYEVQDGDLHLKFGPDPALYASHPALTEPDPDPWGAQDEDPELWGSGGLVPPNLRKRLEGAEE